MVLDVNALTICSQALGFLDDIKNTALAGQASRKGCKGIGQTFSTGQSQCPLGRKAKYLSVVPV
jgi:hypothetical protein